MKRYKCNNCQSLNVTVVSERRMNGTTTIRCEDCGSSVVVSSTAMSVKEFTELPPTPTTQSKGLVGKVYDPQQFWVGYINQHIQDPKARGFNPSSFRVHLEEDKSYVTAEGYHSVPSTSTKMGTINKTVISEKLSNEALTQIWNDISAKFHLPMSSNRCLIEAHDSSQGVEVKVAITLTESVFPAGGRTPTQAEKDMQQGQVVSTTTPSNQKKSYWVAASSSGGLYMGNFGAEVTSPRRAQKFETPARCLAAIQRSGHTWKWKVEEINP